MGAKLSRQKVENTNFFFNKNIASLLPESEYADNLEYVLLAVEDDLKVKHSSYWDSIPSANSKDLDYIRRVQMFYMKDYKQRNKEFCLASFKDRCLLVSKTHDSSIINGRSNIQKSYIQLAMYDYQLYDSRCLTILKYSIERNLSSTYNAIFNASAHFNYLELDAIYKQELEIRQLYG